MLPQSGDYRGQRFMPLLGVGGLIGAAVTEEENQAEQSFNHGKISVDTARLKGEKQYWKNKDGEPLQVTISSM